MEEKPLNLHADIDSCGHGLYLINTETQERYLALSSGWLIGSETEIKKYVSDNISNIFWNKGERETQMITPQEVENLRQQGKTFQEIADIYGCSKQYIHQIACGKAKATMKAPTKAELYAQIDALTRENIALQDKLEAEERERWNALKDRAFEVCREMIPFPNGIIQFLTLEHIDKIGYWFTFELTNDSIRQTLCVRHTDL